MSNKRITVQLASDATDQYALTKYA